jgi:hypothetical protein
MKTMKFCAVLFLLLIGVRVSFFIERYIGDERKIVNARVRHQTNLTQDNIKATLQDLEILQSQSLVPPGSGQGNAVEAFRDFFPVQWPSEKSPVNIWQSGYPATVEQAVRAAETDIAAIKPIAAELSRLGLGWVKESAKFSSWTLDQDMKTSLFFSDAAKLVVLGLLVQGTAKATLSDAVHCALDFSRLVLSLEGVYTNQSAVALISMIRNYLVAQNTVESKSLLEKYVHAPGSRWLLAFEHVSAGMGTLLHPFTPESIIAEVYLQGPMSTFACPSIIAPIETFPTVNGSPVYDSEFAALLAKVITRYRNTCNNIGSAPPISDITVTFDWFHGIRHSLMAAATSHSQPPLEFFSPK